MQRVCTPFLVACVTALASFGTAIAQTQMKAPSEMKASPGASGPDNPCGMPAQLPLASQVKRIFNQTPVVVDTDWYVEAPHPKVTLVVDGEKAAAAGLSSNALASVDPIRYCAAVAPACFQ